MVRLLKKLGWFVVLLALPIAITIYYLAPIATFVTPPLASLVGIDIQSIYINKVTWKALDINHLELRYQPSESKPIELNIEGITAHYDWRELIHQASVQDLQITQAKIFYHYDSHKSSAQKQQLPISLASAATLLPQKLMGKLPIQRVHLPYVELNMQHDDFSQTLTAIIAIKKDVNSLAIKAKTSQPTETEASVTIDNNGHIQLHIVDELQNQVDAEGLLSMATPSVDKRINSHVDQRYVLNSNGRVEIQFNQQPLWLSWLPNIEYYLQQLHFTDLKLKAKWDIEASQEHPLPNTLSNNTSTLSSQNPILWDHVTITGDIDSSGISYLDRLKQGNVVSQFTINTKFDDKINIELFNTQHQGMLNLLALGLPSETLKDIQHSKHNGFYPYTLQSDQAFTVNIDLKGKQLSGSGAAQFSNTTSFYPAMLDLKNISMTADWRSKLTDYTVDSDIYININPKKSAKIQASAIKARIRNHIEKKNGLLSANIYKHSKLQLKDWSKNNISSKNLHAKLKKDIDILWPPEKESASLSVKTSISDIYIDIEKSVLNLNDYPLSLAPLALTLSIHPQAKNYVTGDYATSNMELKTPNILLTNIPVSGSIQISNAHVKTQANLALPNNQQKNLHIDLSHNLKKDKGSATLSSKKIDMATIDWKHINVLPDELKVDQGIAEINSKINWDTSTKNTTITALNHLTLQSLHGQYTDYLFNKLDASITGAMKPDGSWVFESRDFHVHNIDIGIPLLDLTLQSQVRFDESLEHMQFLASDLQTTLLGGKILSDKISFDNQKEKNEFSIQLRDIDLAQLAQLYPESGVEATGRLDGELPIELSRDYSLKVNATTLNTQSPGGTIKYKSEATDAVSQSNEGTDIAFSALRNFIYDDLSSDVNYDPDGTLKLQMRFQGYSPDVMDSRPINLNTNLELNVPALLYSLMSEETGHRLKDELLKKIE